MKKTYKIILKVFLGLIVLIFVALLVFPIFFKDKIKTKVVQVINESVNATVDFSNYKLGFFRNFPNITFSLEGITVTGIDLFENDTLVSLKSADMIFNLASLLGKSGYEIKSVIADQADVRAKVMEDGSANWDIMKESEEEAIEEATSSDMKILLRNISLLNSSLSYTDLGLAMKVEIKALNADMKGDLTLSETNLSIVLDAGEVNFIMDGMKYLNKAIANSQINLQANLDSMRFQFKENYLRLNDLTVNFAGMFAMPDEDIETDLTFYTEETSFKTLLSLIPAVYMSDYSGLNTSGDFSLTGSARGIYSDADSTMPDITVDLKVNNGLISYPDLPEQIKNINIRSDIFVDGKEIDRTTVNVEKFHMEIAGNPFDMNFSLKTPVSDPDIKGSMIGKIDLAALKNALPLDSMNLSGLIDMSVSLAGKLSMIEKEQYDRFNATGNIEINNMLVALKGYPEVRVNKAGFGITPAYADLREANINIGKESDFIIKGKLENYIPYVFDDGIIKGNLNLSSRFIDLGEIMTAMEIDTTSSDTTSLSAVKVPENIDFDFTAAVDQFLYNNIKVNNVRGHMIVRNGILSIKNTGMDLLGGKIIMNAEYDTRDTLNPSVMADLNLENLAVKDAFTTFNSIRKLAPASRGIDGKLNMKFTYKSLIASNLMPVINTIEGGGKIISEEITLLESVAFDKIKEALKLNNKYTNTFKDLNISFNVNQGRVYVSPFSTSVGNIKMNIEGDQGLDQTINYVIRTEIPRSDLGNSVNSLIDNLSSQAAGLGLTYKPSEILKVNLKLSGTFTKPLIVPFFGSKPQDNVAVAKEAIEETVTKTVDTEVAKVKDKARNEIEAQGDKLVQEAEEKAEIIRKEAASAAEKIKTEADNQAQKIVKEAENKGTVAKLAARKAADSILNEGEKRSQQVIREADEKADRLVEEAKAKREDLLKKL